MIVSGGHPFPPIDRHSVSLSLAQLSASIFRKEGLEAWPQLMQLLQRSTHSTHTMEREVGLLPTGHQASGPRGARDGANLANLANPTFPNR